MRKLIAAIMIAACLWGGSSIAGDGDINSSNGDMDFTVNFRFPPTPAQIQNYKTTIDQMAFGICDATDGQVRVRRVTMNQGQANEDLGDFWIHARGGRAGGGVGWTGNFNSLGSHINMYMENQSQPDVWLHELGHQAFGLGEQYPEQRRFGGECGIGRGFQPLTINERNHSIMQQSGSLQCVGGTSAGNRCLTNPDCGGGGTCQFVLMSEMSVASNHDQVQGTDTTCPAARPLSEMVFTGSLDPFATIQAFDDTDFSTADATSTHKFDFEAMDSLGKLPAGRVFVYATRTDTREWQFSLAIDDALTGGTAGDMTVVETWALTFNPDGSLNSVSEFPAEATISGLDTGADDLDLTLLAGTPNPDATPGDGMDGLRHGGGVALTSSADVFPQCDDQCSRRWNTTTSGWETSMHTLWKGRTVSDWEWAQVAFPFLSPPTGLPTAAPPATCFRAVQYDEQVEGSDQVLLLMDKSGSMAWSSKTDIAEVCGNGIDDDEDGDTDEDECADPRMSFAKAAAESYLDLQRNAGIDVGLLEFDDTNTLTRPIAPLDGSSIGGLKTDVGNLTPGGNTGIGDALLASVPEFTRVASIGRTRTAYLMTDGFNTSGISPEDGAEAVKDIGVRVHVIPAGNDVGELELATVAAKTGGVVTPAEDVADLIGIYAELVARHRGAAMTLPRRNFVLSRTPGQFPDGYDFKKEGKISNLTGFALPVEKGSERLTAFVAGRNSKMSTWKVSAKLESPSGRVFDDASPEFSASSHYIFFDIPNPEPGDWRFTILPENPGLQRATALAFIDNPFPDLFIDARPRVLNAGERATISITPAFVSPVEDEFVSLRAALIDNDGGSANLTVDYDRYGRSWSAKTPALATNGVYKARVELTVAPGAQVMAGESIFDGPERPDVLVEPFQRIAESHFIVVNGRQPACRDDRDCDEDGILEKDECQQFPEDIDGDGRPNHRDWDSDGDEIPDNVEGNRDNNGNQIPDRCEFGPLTTPELIDSPGEDSGPVLQEDCLPVTLNDLRLDTKGSARILSRSSILRNFGNKSTEAKRTLEILRNYKADRICYVGRPDPSLTYVLNAKGAPSGALAGEDCISFDPKALTVKNISGRWKIVEGRNWLFDFDQSKSEAEQSLAVIEKYGFTKSCYVGRPDPSFQYLRK